MIFVKPAKFLEPLAQGPLTGWRRPIWSKRSSGSGRVCLNLLLLWKCRQRGLLFTLQTFNSLALIRSWPTVKWTEQGPLGKAPASTLHVSNLGVFVCVWVRGRTSVCVHLQNCQHDPQPICPAIWNPVQPGFEKKQKTNNNCELKGERISISPFLADLRIKKKILCDATLIVKFNISCKCMIQIALCMRLRMIYNFCLQKKGPCMMQIIHTCPQFFLSFFLIVQSVFLRKPLHSHLGHGVLPCQIVEAFQ